MRCRTIKDWKASGLIVVWATQPQAPGLTQGANAVPSAPAELEADKAKVWQPLLFLFSFSILFFLYFLSLPAATDAGRDRGT